jgi:hypothetical protein
MGRKSRSRKPIPQASIVPGDICWLKPKAECPDEDLPVGCFDHPAVVLQIGGSAQTATIFIVSL